MEEKWIKDIREKMADYRATLPEGLLEKAKREAALRNKRAGKSQRKAFILPMWSRVAVAAMAVAVCCLSAWLFLAEEPTQAPLAIDRKPAERPALVAASSDQAEKRGEERSEPINVYPSQLAALPQETVLLARAHGTETQKEETPSQRTATEKADSPTQLLPKKDVRSLPPTRQRQTIGGYGDYRPKRSAQGLALAGYVTGAFGNSGGNVYGSPFAHGFSYSESLPSDKLPVTYATNKSELLSAVESSTRTDHHQPIKVGLSLRLPLSNRWSLSTGVTYSYLGADISRETGATKMETKQKLHYVGIPVNANYSVLRTDRWHLYASAGVEVEKLVSGKQDTRHYEGNQLTGVSEEKVKEGRPQFSGNAAIGAEFRVAGQLSVYAEPGVVYHLDNGSEVDNIYKEHPLNLNVQLGLRWTLE